MNMFELLKMLNDIKSNKENPEYKKLVHQMSKECTTENLNDLRRMFRELSNEN